MTETPMACFFPDRVEKTLYISSMFEIDLKVDSLYSYQDRVYKVRSTDESTGVRGHHLWCYYLEEVEDVQ